MHRILNSSRLSQLGFVAVLVLVWQVVCQLGWVDPIILPKPGSVISAWVKLVQDSAFLRDVGKTLQRVGLAITFATVVGVPLGLYLGYRKRLYRLVEAPLHWLRSVPASALFPLFLLIVGVGESAIVVLGMYPSLLVILVNTVGGAALANRRRLQQAKAFGASTFSLITEVLFFEALPHIINGIRVAVSYALVLVIAVEMFIGVGDAGLGRNIYDSQSAYRIPETYAAIITTGAIGVGLNGLISLIERRVLWWVPAAKDRT